MAERRRVMRKLLGSHGLLPLGSREVLEVGCGSGHVLAGLQDLGAVPERLHGVDLLPGRVVEARRAHPGLDIRQANAEQLPFEDASFDLVLLFVVFSSILDATMQHNVAAECSRVLRSGGHVLWYDFRYDNPSNAHVRGVRRREVERLFPGFRFSLRTLTVVPQLVRRLGRRRSPTPCRRGAAPPTYYGAARKPDRPARAHEARNALDSASSVRPRTSRALAYGHHGAPSPTTAGSPSRGHPVGRGTRSATGGTERGSHAPTSVATTGVPQASLHDHQRHALRRRTWTKRFARR
jgi:ubiquinone/menaquinone biosynthesis C-methylase UbiE